MFRPFTIASALCVMGVVASAGEAQTIGLGLRPMRLEMDVVPGQEKTMSFAVEAPPTDVPVRGRLLLSLGDWRLAEDTSVSYHEPGSQPNSAASWLILSSSDFTITSGQERLVRVTARVPAGTRPGVYSSSVFIQERPPTEAPKPGEQRFHFRFRYVVTVYIVVGPVFSQGELEDVALLPDPKGGQFFATRIVNAGTRHLRPTISWFARRDGLEVAAERHVEATVLLPASSAVEKFRLRAPLPPGEYVIEVQVDFHDGRPIQAIQRSVVVGQSGPVSSQ